MIYEDAHIRIYLRCLGVSLFSNLHNNINEEMLNEGKKELKFLSLWWKWKRKSKLEVIEVISHIFITTWFHIWTNLSFMSFLSSEIPNFERFFLDFNSRSNPKRICGNSSRPRDLQVQPCKHDSLIFWNLNRLRSINVLSKLALVQISLQLIVLTF